MKKLFTLFTFIFVVASCDLPQRSIANYSTPNSDGSNVNTTSTTNTNTDTDTSNNGNTTSNTSGDPGFDHCTSSSQYNGGQIGNFGLCRHASDERKFQVYFANGSSTGTCFVPAHKQSGGGSFKLGIAECVQNQAGQTYYMTLNKELSPPSFTSPRPELINSVMVLSANAVNPYMACMNAKESYMLAARVIPGNYSSPPCCLNAINYNGKLYCLQANAQCNSAADNYANGVCSTFTQNYSGQYKEVNF